MRYLAASKCSIDPITRYAKYPSELSGLVSSEFASLVVPWRPFDSLRVLHTAILRRFDFLGKSAKITKMSQRNVKRLRHQQKGSSGREVLLASTERAELESWTNSRSKRTSLRARVILALAEGLSYREIERRHGASSRTISLWKKRFVIERLAGLRGQHKGSQPRASTSHLQVRVSEAYQKLMNSGTPSSGQLAKVLDLDKRTVQRILPRVRPRTSGMDQLMAAFDPQFGEKVVEIIALYLYPPQCAAVFVVREETANQASIPVEWRGFDHRYASQELYSALVGCKAAEQHKSVRFTDFLASLVQKEGWAPEIHIVLHNLELESGALGCGPGFCPKLWFYSLSLYTTWLDLVQFWFSKIERDMVENEVLAPTPNLFRKVLKYIRSYAKSRHFHWISSPWVVAFPERHTQPRDLIPAGGATNPDTAGITLVKFSPQEREIVRKRILGHSDEKIASELNLALPTVHAHLRSVYAGLGLSSSSKLFVWWSQHPEALAGKWMPRAIHDADSNCPCQHCRLWRMAGGHYWDQMMTVHVTNVAVTPDGRRAISGSGGNTLTVYDLDDARVLRTLKGQPASIYAVALTPDGKRAVFASLDKTLKIWDVNTGRAPRKLEGRAASVYALAVTPDGKRAVSASGRTMTVWDLDRGRALRTLKGHSDDVRGVAVMADGKMAVSASLDGTLKVWDLETGRCLRTLGRKIETLKSTGVDGVAETADGRRLVRVMDGTREEWVETGRASRTLGGRPAGVGGRAVTADDMRAVPDSEDETLKGGDVETGRASPTLGDCPAGVGGVTVTADGKRAVSFCSDTLMVWDVETGRALRTLERHADMSGVAVTPNGKRAVSVSLDYTLKVWDLDRGLLIGTSKWDEPVSCCAFVDERRIFFGDRVGRVCLLLLREPEQQDPTSDDGAIGE